MHLQPGPAERVADDDVAARLEPERRRRQRRLLVGHVAEDGVEEDRVEGALDGGEVSRDAIQRRMPNETQSFGL